MMLNGGAVLIILILLRYYVPYSSADPPTLQYLYTAMTSGIHFTEFTAVGLVGDIQIVNYTSSTRKMIPTTEWIKKVDGDDPDYWKRETNRMNDDQEQFKNMAVQIFQQTTGNHTLQRMYGCERDDGAVTGYDRFGSDGEDFFSLDLKTGTWTADTPDAENFIKKWDPTEDEAKYRKSYLKNECIEWLQKFVSYGNKILERKVRPEVSVFQSHGSSPGIVCFATGFFPSAVNITWRKDGENVYEDVELKETLPNQDRTFQKRSILNGTTEDLQKLKYSCVIQHCDLEEEFVLEVPKGAGSGGGSGGSSSRGSSGAVVGGVLGSIVLIAVGIIIWKKKNSREEKYSS